MHVLRRVHTALVPGGAAVDVRPVLPTERIRAGGRVLGRLRKGEFFGTTTPAVEEAVDAVVAERLFEKQAELRVEVVERYASGADLLEAGDDDGFAERMPRRLRERVEKLEEPVEAELTLLLRRLARTERPPSSLA